MVLSQQWGKFNTNFINLSQQWGKFNTNFINLSQQWGKFNTNYRFSSPNLLHWQLPPSLSLAERCRRIRQRHF